MGQEHKRPTQAVRIIEYITAHGSITQKQAFEDLGCGRLGARIFELKEQGYPIERRMVTVRNRFGEECRVAEYYLA